MDDQSERDFREFVATRSGALLATAFLLTGQRESAEDLLQTVLAKAANRWSRIDAPESYVRRALYHQQVSRWRLRSHGRERLTDTVPEVAGESETSAVDARISLAAALQQLTPRQRAVLTLRYFEDRPESEVADLLDTKVGTVRSQCHRALQRLRTLCPELAPAHSAEEATS